MAPPRRQSSRKKKAHNKGRPSPRQHREKRQRKKDPSAANIHEIQVMGLTEDGEAFARLTDDAIAGHFPLIILDATANASVGDIVQATLTESAPGQFIANITNQGVEEKEVQPLLGVVRHRRQGMSFVPFNRELQAIRFEFVAHHPDLRDGRVVEAKPGRRPSRGPTPVTLAHVVGDSVAGMESAIAIHNHGLPTEFPEDVLGEAAALPAKLKDDEVEEREDLRDIPIVTIDGEDAKDFDDAVWAEKDDDGFHIIVAIADVAHYIWEGSHLDREALDRGNSTYFPDRVIPMLPERLSNDLCSLRPKVDRPVLAVHLWINSKGNLVKHRFSRAVIHSTARLTYTRVQKALDGQPDGEITPLMSTTIAPLYEAFQCLLKARKYRGAIDLDIPEKYIEMDEKGHVTGIRARERLAAHQLIEEFMILANVAAAQALGSKSAPCLYRIHPSPEKTKLDTLKLALATQGIKFTTPAADVRSKDYAKLVEKIRHHDASPFLMQSILQSQQQAKYDPQNVGHFGLALGQYAHFTSPIRRYSDLVVHRSLIATLKLPGQGALGKSAGRLKKMADGINTTERRSQKAEWEARDRMTAEFYNKFVGDIFEGLITSVQPFGVFLSIDDGAVEGLLPMRLMKDDFYRFDEKKQMLIGQKRKKKIALGNRIKVKLIAADGVDGRLTFAFV